MNFKEAKFIFHKHYYTGRNLGKTTQERFPFSEQTYKDDDFIIEEINTSSLKPKIARPELVVSYKKTIHNLPPIFVSVGRLLTDNTVCRFQDHTIKIMDGNHRAQAHIELGIKTITAILPLSHWRALNDS